MIPALKSRKTLALIPGPRAVALAEGQGADARRQVRCRTFAFPAGMDWDRPAELGQALRAFLQAQGIRGRGADTVGFPAAWMALRTVSFPPAEDPALLPGMIEIAADELFAERLEELAYGYAASNGGGGLDVSIAACHKSRLSQFQAVCDAAGLTVRSVVPLAMGVAQRLDLPAGQNLLVLQHGREAEVAIVSDRRVTWLRPLSGGALEAGELAAELRRAAMAMPERPTGGLFVLGEAALAKAAEEAFGMPAAIPQAPAAVGLEMADGCVAALAAIPRGARLVTLDLLSAQGRVVARNWKPLIRRGALAAAAVAALALWAALTWHSARSQAGEARAKLDAMAPQARQVHQLQSFVEATNSWHRPNTGYLDALRDLTTQFPDEGSIWLTSLEMDSTGQMTLAGKARDRSDVLDLLGRLRGCGSFDQVSPHFVRQQTGRERTVSFAVTCRYSKGTRT